MGPSDCEIMCRINCSCNAYASLREDGTGCQLYYGDKKDLHKIIGKGDGIIYVRGDACTISGKLTIIIENFIDKFLFNYFALS